MRGARLLLGHGAAQAGTTRELAVAVDESHKLWSKDQGNRVVDAFEEIDVSGKLPLARRPGC